MMRWRRSAVSLSGFTAARGGLLAALLAAAGAAAGCDGHSTIALFEPGTGGAAGGPSGSCTSSAECTPLAPYCDEGRGECVECLGDAHCDGERCEPATGSCVECLDSADCGGDGPHCQPSSHECVDCLVPEHCALGESCHPLTSKCAQACSGSAQCTSTHEPHCDEPRGVCVECLGDAHCLAEGEPFCDTTAGRCRECLNDTTCSGSEPFCDTTEGACAECLQSSHCAPGQICNEERRCRD